MLLVYGEKDPRGVCGGRPTHGHNLCTAQHTAELGLRFREECYLSQSAPSPSVTEFLVRLRIFRRASIDKFGRYAVHVMAPTVLLAPSLHRVCLPSSHNQRSVCIKPSASLLPDRSSNICIKARSQSPLPLRDLPPNRLRPLYHVSRPSTPVQHHRPRLSRTESPHRRLGSAVSPIRLQTSRSEATCAATSPEDCSVRPPLLSSARFTF